MNIHAKKGDKVKFWRPDQGYKADREMTAGRLIVGRVYTVNRTEVDTWSTRVYLEEFPGLAFNSVQFEDV